MLIMTVNIYLHYRKNFELFSMLSNSQASLPRMDLPNIGPIYRAQMVNQRYQTMQGQPVTNLETNLIRCNQRIMHICCPLMWSSAVRFCNVHRVILLALGFTLTGVTIWLPLYQWSNRVSSNRISVNIIRSHYIDVLMITMASQITSLMIVYSIVYSGAVQRKHQSSASLAFVRGIHRTGEFPATKGQ